MKFYSYLAKDKELGFKEFVELYEKAYFFENPDLELERRIVEILNKRSKSTPDELTPNDIIDIMRWKMGSKNYNKEKVVGRSTVFAKDISDVISKNVSYEKNDGASKLLTELCRVSGIDLTYSITILYFLSGGVYPIYDQFAQVAVNAIVNNKKIGEKVECPNASKVAYNKFRDNIKSIEKQYKVKYSENRDIDRALWAYGHLFYKEKQ